MHKAIPDGEQILEVLSVLAAGLFTYWFIRNGPVIEPARPLDIGRPNTWALDIRNFRLEDGERALTEVPTTRSWFLMGAVLGAPFAISFGSMLGREFYGWRRRRAQKLSDEAGDNEEIGGDEILSDSDSMGFTDEDMINLAELEAGDPEPKTSDDL